METPKYDLLEFIKNEKKRWNNIEAEKAPMIYTKHSSKTLVDIYSKLYTVSNLNLLKLSRQVWIYCFMCFGHCLRLHII